MSGFVHLEAGCTVSVRRTRLNVVVLLTLALKGESPTCILHEGISTPRNTSAACEDDFGWASSIYLFTYPSIHPSIHPSIAVSIHHMERI